LNEDIADDGGPCSQDFGRPQLLEHAN